MSYSSKYSSRSTSSGSPARNGNSESQTVTTSTTTRRAAGQTSQRPDPVSTERVKMEMNSLQRQIDEFDKKLETAENQESQDLDRLVEDVKETTRRQIQQGAEVAATDFRKMCENQLESLKRREDQYQLQQKENMKEYQDNIFKTNKVFREVSKLLREDWQHLFRVLCARIPADLVEQEVLILEGEKPMMQPYKALVRWKEMDIEGFSLDRLIQVLQEGAMFEAAQKAREIMFSDSSSYIQDSAIKPLPQVNTTRVAEILASVGDRTAREFNRAEGGETYQEEEVRISSGPSWDTMNTGPIRNSKLLFLSKKVGGDWKQLGKRLGVSDQEMSEIEELMDGDNQKCAFQTLFKWRDGVSGSDESNAETLAQVFRGIGKGDLAEDISA